MNFFRASEKKMLTDDSISPAEQPDERDLENKGGSAWNTPDITISMVPMHVAMNPEIL